MNAKRRHRRRRRREKVFHRLQAYRKALMGTSMVHDLFVYDRFLNKVVAGFPVDRINVTFKLV